MLFIEYPAAFELPSTYPVNPNYDDFITPLRVAQAETKRFQDDCDARGGVVSGKTCVVPTPTPQPISTAPAMSYSGSHVAWMAAAGISPSDYSYVEYIVDHESGWVPTKWNYADSGAYGLGQALPASKMAPWGADYMTNPVTQLQWATAYATARYGSWAGAYAYWSNHHVW